MQSPRPTGPVLDFLLSRRSRPAKLLKGPVPERAELELLLTAAARVPDHGKLEPWRFVVLEKAALLRLSGVAASHAADVGYDEEKTGKGVSQLADSPLCVVVIASPKASDKIPAIEQTLSAGAVCLSLVNAALAAGWGASWLTGWVAHDGAFASRAFDLAEGEWVAGLVHIGSTASAPPERPRPDLATITAWVSE